jgi:hypothetical protein
MQLATYAIVIKQLYTILPLTPFAFGSFEFAFCFNLLMFATLADLNIGRNNVTTFGLQGVVIWLNFIHKSVPTKLRPSTRCGYF